MRIVTWRRRPHSRLYHKPSNGKCNLCVLTFRYDVRSHVMQHSELARTVSVPNPKPYGINTIVSWDMRIISAWPGINFLTFYTKFMRIKSARRTVRSQRNTWCSRIDIVAFQRFQSSNSSSKHITFVHIWRWSIIIQQPSHILFVINEYTFVFALHCALVESGMRGLRAAADVHTHSPLGSNLRCREQDIWFIIYAVFFRLLMLPSPVV